MARMLVVGVMKPYDGIDSGEMMAVAHSIASNNSFANPFQIPTGPTAHVAPAYAYFLALLLKAAPSGLPFKLITVALGTLASSLTWALLPLAAACMEIDWRAGLCAGLLGAVNPLRHLIELDGTWEASFAALSLLLLVLLSFRWRRRFKDVRYALVLGGCWGLALWLQPEFVSVFLAILVLLLASAPRGSRLVTFRSVWLALASMSIVIAPWIIRNEFALGGFTFMRSNFGLELDISNNDHAFAEISQNLHRNSNSSHPDVNIPEARRMAAVGELNYYRFRLRRALGWISGHPLRFLELSAQRFVYFWIPLRRLVLLRAAEALITLAALAGLAMLIQARSPASWFIVAIWISQPMVYYFIQADERYRYPIEWIIALCAGYFLTASRHHGAILSSLGRGGLAKRAAITN
ncbi:MAG TPA: hypothetical protein VFW83_08025 [Bryobacteraceae bacterium]|nr:hypothetical protein [Bryobacteraceae bacterium]